MRKKYIFGKKLYISVLTSILVLLTTVATTFAWVGVFANSTFERFDVNLKASSLEEYGIVISATGEEGTFSDSIDGITIKRQILKNWGYKNVEYMTAETVEALFSELNMHQCTTLPVVNGDKLQKLGDFKTIENMDTMQYFKFDIFVSATSFYGNSDSSTFLLDAFINPGLLHASTKSFTLNKPITYESSFVNPLVDLPENINKVSGGDTITTGYSNVSSAARVAFEKYEVVQRGMPSMYEGKEPISTIIYSGDSFNYPTKNTNNGCYEFGGILPDSQNLAVLYYNQYDYKHSNNGVKHVSVPSDIYNVRGVESVTADKTLHSNTNHLIDSQNVDEKIGLTSMMKVTVSFWIEGWDADCFSILDRNPITLSISLGLVNEEVF